MRARWDDYFDLKALGIVPFTDRTKEASRVQLTLTESDFVAVMSKSAIGDLKGPEGHLADNAAKVVIDALPKALASKVNAMMPQGFALRSIELKVQLSGAVFGCGLSGEATVIFGPDADK